MTQSTHTEQTHHVLIVGGGFGGIKTALELAKHSHIKITLLSNQSDFCYYPSLYRTATGGLRAQTSIPLTQLLPGNRVTIVQGTAKTLDRKRKAIITIEGNTIPFDSLILGLGVITNYFGIKGIEQYAYGIKSATEVQRFKAHLHQQLIDDKKPDSNYIVVGAGPTGIELAGALPAYITQIMQNHGLPEAPVHVAIIEAMPQLLPRSPKPTSRAVQRQLKQLGIKLYLNQAVESQTSNALIVNGKPIESQTVIWTAGMANHPFFAQNNFASNERHKVVVNEYLEAEPDIYVIGDNAATQYSGLAQTALHDACFVSEHIVRKTDNKELKAYVPKQPISIITAGPFWAAVDWGKRHIYGKFGWMLRQAADWTAFHDFQGWWPALEQWSTEFGTEETCPVCVSNARQ